MLNLSRHYQASISIFLLSVLITFLSPLSAEENTRDSYWKYANLHTSPQGDYLKLAGRLQLDLMSFDDNNTKYEQMHWRRFRFGFKGQYGFTTAALEGDFDLHHNAKNHYKRLTDANLSWSFHNLNKLTVLKQSAGFTLDGYTSSKKLLTPERNNLTNNLWFTSEYFTGISYADALGKETDYKVGFYSSDGSNEISISDGSYFSFVSVAHQLTKNTLWDGGDIRLDYIYNDAVEDGDTRDFSTVLSASSKFNKGQWHLWNDMSYGAGALAQSDIWGLVVMPFYQQNKYLQWVSRYSHVTSKYENGVRLNRYENKLESGRGDNYHEFYAGVNYLFNRHKLKVQLGAQYAVMEDHAKDGGEYKGWGFTLALRSYW